MLCFPTDPGKYNFTPRLFHLSVQSGTFKGVELLNPSRVTGVAMAMPFLQDNLYSVSQPGKKQQMHHNMQHTYTSFFTPMVTLVVTHS